ncbi:MAG: hypothetical protein ACK4RF_08680 [Cyclobacteriaceae bacterium]
MRTVITSLTLVCVVTGALAQWATVNSSHTRHTNNGNVGIGTASGVTPSDKLHVIGDARADNVKVVNGSFNSLSSSGLFLNTNGTTRVTILNSNGFVGIANSSPSELLHVNGNARAMQFNSVNGSFNALATSNINLLTNGTNRVTILSSNGNVGIGTTSPTALLHVNGALNASTVQVGSSLPGSYKMAVGGKIICEEVVVKLQANWPDYVFEAGYQLPTLEELQLFIAKNKHLPGIPSAKEVADKGVALGEINTKLLQKIEELTLYIIELKKDMETLKASNH